MWIHVESMCIVLDLLDLEFWDLMSVSSNHNKVL